MGVCQYFVIMTDSKQLAYLEIRNIHPQCVPEKIGETISAILGAEGSELEVVLLSHVKSGLTDQV